MPCDVGRAGLQGGMLGVFWRIAAQLPVANLAGGGALLIPKYRELLATVGVGKLTTNALGRVARWNLTERYVVFR